MKKVLITGSTGLLGATLRNSQPGHVDGLYAGYHSRGCHIQIDIANKLSLYRLFSDYKPDTIIHAASLGNVDFCEKVPHIAEQVNVLGTKNIVDILNELKYKPKFVYISTNAVYGGNNSPYNEESDQNPINKYGYTKRTAEKYIRRNYEDWLIVRPFMLFGFPYLTGRENWLTILIDKFDNDEEVSLIDDIVWQPTSAKFAAETIWFFIDKEFTNESLNLSQGNSMSLYDFGKYVQSIFAPDKDLVKPISRNEFKTVARRPIDTSYDIAKLKSLVDVPKVTDELEKLYAELK